MAGFNGKKRNNYFSNNIKEYGENFLTGFDAKKLRNDAKRVFSDIAFGNIDYDQYWPYFTDPMFISALVDVASSKYTIHAVSYNAIFEHVAAYGTDQQIDTILRYHKRNMEAYKILTDTFMQIKANQSSGESLYSLKILSNKMKEYAQDMIDPVFGNLSAGINPVAAPIGGYPVQERHINLPTVTTEPPMKVQNEALSQEVGVHFTIRTDK